MLSLASSVVATIPAWAPPAHAAPGCAPTGALGLAAVTLTSPAPGPVPARFKVSGRASATLPISQIELLVGGSVVASRTFAPDTEVTFDFDLGPEQVGPGPKALQVVACGGGALAGTSLVRGESAAVAVQVQPPATTTSSRPATSTTSASTTTTAPASTTTTKAKLAVAAPGPLAGELAGGLTDGGADGRAALSPPTGSEEARRLLLSGDGDPGGVPPRQAWVGLVVVASGAVALGVSVLLGRGRAAA